MIRARRAQGILCAVAAGIAVSAAQAPLARPDLRLELVDREGRRTLVGMLPGATFAPRISPDGKEVLYDTSNDGVIWIAKMSDVNSKRRLSSEDRNRGPMWSGDGRRVLYIIDHEGAETMFWRASDGTGAAELIQKPARAPESWSSAQQRFSFITFNNSDYDIWTYSLADKRATPFAAVAGSPQHSSRFSPDGRWIAYVSAETGVQQVYVQPFPGPGPKIQITKAGGGHPLWSSDQAELFFDNNGRMFVTTIRTGATPSAGEPVALPISGFVQGPLRRQYDLMPDGKQFLMLFPQGR